MKLHRNININVSLMLFSYDNSLKKILVCHLNNEEQIDECHTSHLCKSIRMGIRHTNHFM